MISKTPVCNAVKISVNFHFHSKFCELNAVLENDESLFPMQPFPTILGQAERWLLDDPNNCVIECRHD